MLALALPPRLLDTDRFVTTDELFWVGRSAQFARALATGQYAGTFQSGHPGVTTMWPALLGAGPDTIGQLAGSRREVSRREVSEDPAFMPTLAAARRGLGVATALGVVLATLLAWRVFGLGAAAIGGVLLALDPFLLAHSRLVHIDASLAIWMTVAVLAALARAEGGGRALVVLSGAATALALLSKSPALSLAAFVPLALLVPRLRRGVGWQRTTLADLGVWVIGAALLYCAIWPAVWVAPADTLTRVFGFVGENANAEHAAAADSDGVGLLFYPLVLVFRSTPAMLLGLALLPACGPRDGRGRTVAVLGVVALAFAAAMTVAAKGFDRYLLPIFPILDLLAGLGLWLGVNRHCASRPGAERPHAAATAGVASLVGALSLWAVVSAWPYELTYANPLVGGLPAAHRSIASGWGEGLDRVADHLNAKPDAERLKVGVPGEIYTTVLGAQLRGQVGPIDPATADPSAWDFVAVYIRNVQAGDTPAFLDGLLLAWAPEHTVTLHGVEYARLYDTRRGVPVGASFGDGLVLEGYGIDAASIRPGRRVQIRLRWSDAGSGADGRTVAIELRPRDGGPALRVAQPLTSAGAVSRAPGAAFVTRHDLPVDQATAPGSYMLAIQVAGGSGSVLPPVGGAQPTADAPRIDDAIALRTVTIR